jgi:hypothetical protein
MVQLDLQQDDKMQSRLMIKREQRAKPRILKKSENSTLKGAPNQMHSSNVDHSLRKVSSQVRDVF